MFEGFEDEMIDFFWAVRFNNNRAWFAEHKPTYVSKVYEPLKELARDVCTGMETAHGLESLWKCSRIYRDARRPQPDGPYRDHLWFVLAERERWSMAPTFYAEISAEGITYGFGSYCCTPDFMKNVRAAMAAHPARMERMIRAFEKDGSYRLDGTPYKRPKGHVSDRIDPWYNLKNIGFSAFEEWNDDNMGPGLPAYLVRRFGVLLPLYRWLWTCVPPEEPEETNGKR